MGKRATLRMSPPGSAADKFHANGFFPASIAAAGPVTLTVTVNGQEAGKSSIQASAQPFELTFTLPEQVRGSTSPLTIELEVDRVTRVPGDKRDLGLIFGTFSIRP